MSPTENILMLRINSKQFYCLGLIWKRAHRISWNKISQKMIKNLTWRFFPILIIIFFIFFFFMYLFLSPWSKCRLHYHQKWHLTSLSSPPSWTSHGHESLCLQPGRKRRAPGTILDLLQCRPRTILNLNNSVSTEFIPQNKSLPISLLFFFFSGSFSLI